MTTKLFTLFLTLVASIGIINASVTIDGIAYNLNEDSLTAEVTRHGSYSGEVVIPPSVTYESATYSVTSIGYMAFHYCSGLTSVTIGNSVTSIGRNAFSGCSGLMTITLPNSITSIGEFAFSGCSGLTSVEIPNSVTRMENYVFSYCSGLTSVTCLGETPTTLGSDVFYGCDNLSSIYVPCGTLNAYKQSWSDYSSEIKYHPLQYNIIGNVNIADAGFVTLPLTICDDTIISATSNCGYHFTQWSDGVIDNPRTIVLTQDTTFTAVFAANPRITYLYNSSMGYVTGPTMTATCVAADSITFKATSKYGYHFVQWNDGITDNPRTIWLSQDTTFTAEFALDRSGTCGNDLALTWEYDTISKTLTISGNGAFEQNMQCGVEARGALTKVVFADGVTSIGASAFSGITTLQTLVLSKDVKKINKNAFYNCENMAAIYNYASVPANVYSNTFDGVNKFTCVLYVPQASIDMYKAASVWRDFYYVQAISGEPQGTEIVEGKYPVQYLDKESAELHSETITLHVPVAPIIEGFTFLYWQPVAQDISTGIIIQAVYEANEPSSAPSAYTNPANPAQKLIRNGNVYILTDDHTYTITGQEVR